MDNKNFLKFIAFLQCPICNGEFLQKNIGNLNCSSCGKVYKIHKNNIPKLFTPENIYPTKEKIYWKNIYE